jgi:hypothetical protein
MIDVQNFLKVFGSDGVQFVLESDTPDEAYTGEITSVEPIQGYGVPLTDKLWEVFTSQQQAERFYRRQVGEITSNDLIFEPSGIRHRDMDYFD